jgi:DNA replication protein DnaC
VSSKRCAGLTLQLRKLKLPSFVAHYEEIAEKAQREDATFEQYLSELVTLELSEREVRKVERLRKGSGLPAEKTLANLDQKRLPAKVRRLIPTLCEGGFAERAENILAFGMPGRGKSHTLSAICHELVQHGISVLWRPAYHIVQRLLAAKRDLRLEAELRRLDRFDVVVLDDIGYVQQDREEMEVLFTLLAERYERRSVMITSNLVFSQWDKIFKDAMTTAAAIDRLVHHSIILELTGESFRTDAARKRNQAAIKDDSVEK